MRVGQGGAGADTCVHVLRPRYLAPHVGPRVRVGGRGGGAVQWAGTVDVAWLWALCA